MRNCLAAAGLVVAVVFSGCGDKGASAPSGDAPGAAAMPKAYGSPGQSTGAGMPANYPGMARKQAESKSEQKPAAPKQQ